MDAVAVAARPDHPVLVTVVVAVAAPTAVLHPPMAAAIYRPANPAERAVVLIKPRLMPDSPPAVRFIMPVAT